MRAWPGVPLAGIAPIVRGAVDAGRFAPLHFLRTGSPSHQRRLLALLLADRRKGVLQISEALLGMAGRHRTLGLEKLIAFEVPMPSLVTQKTLDGWQANIAEWLPATLERVFREPA